ncbi:MAG TPA: alpha-ribazole phosphatase [Thermoanaerobaculia bacterium]|jgi:alpha-ribazole phosphatase
MTRIYLVRHGRAEGQEGRAVGHHDLPLSASGAAAARRLGATWQGPPPDALHASDLRRAAATARLLAAAWGLPVTLDPRLREIGFGDWEGRAWQEIHERDGERFAAWSQEWWTARIPAGESYPELAARAHEWLAEILEVHAGRTVVAVAHGGSIRALLAHALGLPRETVFRLRLDPAGVTGLAAGKGGLEVLCVNSGRFPEAAAGP